MRESAQAVAPHSQGDLVLDSMNSISVSVFFFLIYFLLVFNLLTYRITPSARHPFTPTPRPPPLLPPLVRFPELAVFTFCLPFWYFPHISSPFPYIPFHYYLYSPNEWEHIMFVLLRLTYFTQHNTLQFHPRWSKWWVFVVSNGWGIFHCIYIDHCFFTHSSSDTSHF